VSQLPQDDRPQSPAQAARPSLRAQDQAARQPVQDPQTRRCRTAEPFSIRGRHYFPKFLPICSPERATSRSDRDCGWAAGVQPQLSLRYSTGGGHSRRADPCTNPGYAESVDENAWRSEPESSADRAFPLHHEEPVSAWRELRQLAAAREKSPITSDSEK